MSTDPKTYFDDTADAGQTDFTFNFEYLEDSHVTVEIDGVATTDFTIVTSPAKKIVLDTPATGGEIVRVIRKSQPDTNLVDFVNGSVLTESELDRAYLHNRYLAEESAEQNDVSMRLTAGATGFDALNKKILNVVDPTSDQDAATKNYVDETVAGVALGTVPDGSITAAKLDTDAVTTAKIEDGAVTSAKISDTDANFSINSSGQVRIGTTDTPSSLLTVDGTVEILKDRQSGTPEGGQIILRAQDSNEERFVIDNYGVGDSIYRIYTTDDAGTQAGVERFVIKSSDGHVGISKANPLYALDVAGDVNVSLGNTFKINGNNLLLDEDTMTSNSDTQGATQQSIKAYVDSQVLSKYASAWFNDTTGLVNGGTYAFTHNLGTAEAQVEIWMATSGAGADVKLVAFDTDSTDIRGASVTAISTTSLTVQLTNAGWTHLNADGSRTTGNWGTTYTHIKVVVIG